MMTSDRFMATCCHVPYKPYLPSLLSLPAEIPFTAYLFFAPTLDQEPKGIFASPVPWKG